MVQYIMSKSIQHLKAVKLRKEGKSIKEIAKKLSVSPGSVSVWCRHIHLTKSQIKILEKRTKDPFYGNRSKYLISIKQAKNLKIQRLMDKGINEVGKITKRELFLIGIALYWAEGFKKDKQAGFANSDPKMIKTYIKWLKDCFGYKNEDLLPRITINVSHNYRANEIQNYWSTIINVPAENFGKPFYQKTIWKKTYENPNEYYGVLRTKVRKSLDFLRKIHGYIEGLKQNSL